MLSEFYNTDAIFGFAIRAHLQLAANRGDECENQQLTRILDISIHDWKGEDRSGSSGGSGGVPYTMRYAAVLGSQLLECIRSSEAKVLVPGICRVAGLLIAELFSTGRAGAVSVSGCVVLVPGEREGFLGVHRGSLACASRLISFSSLAT